jgi:predicted nuclease with TOPRIM domain
MLDRPYIIHHRRPYRCLLLILLSLTLGVAAVWYWGQQWRAQQLEKLTALQAQHQQLLQENQRLTEQNQTLNTQVTDSKQRVAMREATDAQLEAELQELQQQVIALNKELLFYQNITQGNASSKLQVRELLLRPVADDPSSFIYRIVLTQGKRITQPISGEVLLTLNLADNGEAHSRLIEKHDLNIRHVQVLEGPVKLAENEQPDSLRVLLRQEDKTLIDNTFEWEVTPSPAP